MTGTFNAVEEFSLGTLRISRAIYETHLDFEADGFWTIATVEEIRELRDWLSKALPDNGSAGESR